MNPRTALVLALLLAVSITVIHSLSALSVPGLSSDDAYLHLRQMDSIRTTWLPLVHDPLAPAGSRLLVTPLYDYLLAFASVFLSPIVVLKVVPAILVGLLVFLVFLLTSRITQDNAASLLAAFCAAVMPVLSRTTVNTANAAPFVLMLALFLLLQLVRFEGRALPIYALVIILLSFAHPSVVLVLLGLLFYAALMVVSDLRIERGMGEVLLFSTLFIVWSLAVRFKDILVSLGPGIIFQNIPSSLRASSFAQLSVLDAVFLIGIVPVLVGSYIIYTYMFREQHRDIYLLLGFALAMGVMLWLGAVDHSLGLIFLGIILSVLFGVGVKRSSDYLRGTKASGWALPLGLLLLLVIVFSSLWPAINMTKMTLAAAPLQDELDDLRYMADAIPSDSVLLTMPEEGFEVEAVAGFKVVQDGDFTVQHDAAQRYQDVQTMFTSHSKVDAVTLLNKYHVTHIYLSRAAQKRYAMDMPFYASGESCFPVVHRGAALLLSSVCKVESR